MNRLHLSVYLYDHFTERLVELCVNHGLPDGAAPENSRRLGPCPDQTNQTWQRVSRASVCTLHFRATIHASWRRKKKRKMCLLLPSKFASETKSYDYIFLFVRVAPNEKRKNEKKQNKKKKKKKPKRSRMRAATYFLCL